MSYIVTDEEIIGTASRPEFNFEEVHQEHIDFARAILALSKDAMGSRLIDAWCDSHGGKISWVKAVAICAIVTGMSEDERAHMLALNDDGEPMGIVQRLRNGGQPDLANIAEQMQLSLQELVEKANLSDDSNYSTLSTSYVREVCKRGIDAANGKAADLTRAVNRRADSRGVTR